MDYCSGVCLRSLCRFLLWTPFCVVLYMNPFLDDKKPRIIRSLYTNQTNCAQRRVIKCSRSGCNHFLCLFVDYRLITMPAQLFVYIFTTIHHYQFLTHSLPHCSPLSIPYAFTSALFTIIHHYQFLTHSLPHCSHPYFGPFKHRQLR
jgi:hypothetical protein